MASIRVKARDPRLRPIIESATGRTPIQQEDAANNGIAVEAMVLNNVNLPPTGPVLSISLDPTLQSHSSELRYIISVILRAKYELTIAPSRMSGVSSTSTILPRETATAGKLGAMRLGNTEADILEELTSLSMPDAGRYNVRNPVNTMRNSFFHLGFDKILRDEM
ncbi:hypothetical protein [Aeropyrum camini]|uniref:Uncharacterized protein n=1 Tax=Aeropyrum camini SY1 = JCM 12091 TaxID=1198449 RepID=U3TI87_9CREN|nr:hypothetical protein [Aeropyrum camini]BAN91069.1 hypothetical protein ACAM_1600 [Aeropyrum camini SY1 = JCM 12091]